MAAQDTANPKQAAREAGLRYVSDRDPGIVRLRRAATFSYRDPDGAAVRDRDTLERIVKLAIPPAWNEVWICPHPHGHLQATGRDARTRKQYRYHPQWSAVRDGGKFERIIAFAEALPRLRRALRASLKPAGFGRDKVVAMVVAVMADTLIRIGNAEYAKQNRSFGLTTLRNRHVGFLKGGRARFQFTGKSGQVQDVVLDDAKLVRLMRRCQQLPGQALFQYLDDDGQRVPVGSDDVNGWLREAMGEAFTAKDFRTWGGTLEAFRAFAATPPPEGDDGTPAPEREWARIEKEVIAGVAQSLGNTVAVCRKAYIDPAVMQGWRDGTLARYAKGAIGERQWEQAALRFLKSVRRQAARKPARPKRAAARAA